MAEGYHYSRQINVAQPLAGIAHPFHRDSQNGRPALVTNGGGTKMVFAAEAGIPPMNRPDVKSATCAAEDRFHASNGDGVFGPAVIYGLPYPLALADEKLYAAWRVLEGRGEEPPSFFAHDATYGVEIPSAGIDLTVHKPKSRADEELLVRFLHDAALSGQARLTSRAGISRYDAKTRDVERYAVVTTLGVLKPFDHAQMLGRLKENGAVSMGTSTPEVFGFLVDMPDYVTSAVYRYDPQNVTEPELVGGRLLPKDVARAQTSTDNNLNIQMSGLGFFPV